jgi:leader peptidase (prepilin peptidase) / N-methyltransferase
VPLGGSGGGAVTSDSLLKPRPRADDKSLMVLASSAAACLGAVVGSFLNVVAHRLPLGMSVAFPASHCPRCEQPVRPWDNVPVFSWLVLGGRCRSCREPISIRYPLVELATAAAFGLVVVTCGVDADLLLELPFVAMLITVAAVDIDHRLVPNRILAPTAAWGVGASVLVRPTELGEVGIAAAAAFTALLLAALAYPGGMGMGDVKLAGVMGLYLGLAVVPALFVAFAAGALVGIAMIIREGAAARKSAVPFAPFLALGGLIGVTSGDALLGIYVDSFLR